MMDILDEASESYWKLITERRKRAIDETIAENDQVDSIGRISPRDCYSSYIN